ncbi:Toll/interleukin-1 receptor homology (TIR) domain [Arabidopsis suecica]|uniref:Toll/interleukin-1 receptor homology (TIR) domain n=1 Tax=Arabidopsis suecica TaxID=45249 RepID=A0A8T1XV41_ARASU|nr:Toll/interleukin-1 receptor homology (TIR) domain [Arabidopsis suecica]
MAGASLVSSSSCSSSVSLIPTRPQVFINFRGKELRKGFISFLVPALKDNNINVFIDDQEERGKYLTSLFDRIGESKIALVIFSEDYTESKWCLDELVQIKECMDQNKLRVIPIFYKLDPAVVKRLQGKFGDQFRDLEYRYKHKPERPQKWKEAVISVCQTFALFLPEHSDTSDKDFIMLIVKEVGKVLPEGGFSVSASQQSRLTMSEAQNEEAVEIYRPNNMTENFQNRNQLPGLSYEFKFLVLGRPKGNTFMIGARGLSITCESVVEIAYLRKASWLDVEGKFDTRYLSPSTRYEVVFVVLLQYTKFKWKKPVKLKLVLPNSREQPQEHRMSMAGHITNQWIDIPVGEFTTSVTNIGEISFAMYEYECQLWKSGLFVKGVTIRPKY